MEHSCMGEYIVVLDRAIYSVAPVTAAVDATQKDSIKMKHKDYLWKDTEAIYFMWKAEIKIKYKFYKALRKKKTREF